MKKIRNTKKPKDLSHLIYGPNTRKFGFCARLIKNAVKRNVSDKKGMLSHCKSVVEKIGANLAYIQAENLQNVQKMHFWLRVHGVNRLNTPT